MQVSYTARRGFCLVCPKRAREGEGPPSALPSKFMPLESKARGVVQCATEELTSLNCKLKNAIHDCLLLTEQACAPCTHC